MQLSRAVVVLVGNRMTLLSTQCTESFEVALVGGLIIGQQRKQAAAFGRLLLAKGHAVIHEVAVTEALEQPGIAELLEMLRNARLALHHDLGQFRHCALTPHAQRQQAQPNRVSEGLEMRDQLFGTGFHNV